MQLSIYKVILKSAQSLLSLFLDFSIFIAILKSHKLSLLLDFSMVTSASTSWRKSGRRFTKSERSSSQFKRFSVSWPLLMGWSCFLILWNDVSYKETLASWPLMMVRLSFLDFQWIHNSYASWWDDPFCWVDLSFLVFQWIHNSYASW